LIAGRKDFDRRRVMLGAKHLQIRKERSVKHSKPITHQRDLPLRGRMVLYAHVDDTKGAVIRRRIEDFLAKLRKEQP